MKAEIIILNSKQRKEIRQSLQKQFGISSLPDMVFFCLNSKERVYVANRSVFEVEHSSLRVNAFGMYFGTFMVDGFRLSIEGAQMLFDQCTTHIHAVDAVKRKEWFLGNDISCTADLEPGYYILTFDDLIIGVAKKKGDTFMNYLPKSRRLTHLFE
ncbi:MAG: methyltransferase RsmF C-terminal domain-like protein [Nanoarchaeota archaeon]